MKISIEIAENTERLVLTWSGPLLSGGVITRGWSSRIGSSKAVKYGTQLILNLRQVRPQKIETRPGKHSSCLLSYNFKIFHADCVSRHSLPITNGCPSRETYSTRDPLLTFESFFGLKPAKRID